jgi:hypothetical protein
MNKMINLSLLKEWPAVEVLPQSLKHLMDMQQDIIVETEVKFRVQVWKLLTLSDYIGHNIE